MKTFGYASLIFLLALSLLTGCETTRSITSSISGSADENLLAQVPAGEQGEVQKAEYALQVSEEKLNLAKLKTERASLQKKYADYEEDVADEYLKEAEVSLDLAKFEAIDKAGLGDREANRKKIADLTTKKFKIKGNRTQLEYKRNSTERKINDLSKQIEEQETKIINLEAAGVPEPEPSDVVKKGEQLQEKVSETKSEEPEAK